MGKNTVIPAEAAAHRLKREKAFQKVLPYLMLAPALIFILVFKIYPMISVSVGSRPFSAMNCSLAWSTL